MSGADDIRAWYFSYTVHGMIKNVLIFRRKFGVFDGAPACYFMFQFFILWRSSDWSNLKFFVTWFNGYFIFLLWILVGNSWYFQTASSNMSSFWFQLFFQSFLYPFCPTGANECECWSFPSKLQKNEGFFILDATENCIWMSGEFFLWIFSSPSNNLLMAVKFDVRRVLQGDTTEF